MIDGLRAVAIALVVMYHYGVPRVSGGLGVNIFFVISGFLITWLLLKEHAASGTVSFKNFYARRTLRIFPAYYTFVAVFLGLSVLHGDAWTLGNRLAAMTYTMDWYVALHPAGPRVAHLWSLAVEEHFYLVWPVLFTLAARNGRRFALLALGTVIVGGIVWRTVAHYVLGASSAYLYYAFDTRLDNLAVGCFVAVSLAQEGRARRLASRLASHSWLPLGTAALLVAQSTVTGWYRDTFGYTAEAALAGVLLVQVLQLQRSRLWGWLELRPVRYLGTLSYSLYLYHPLGERLALRVPGLPRGWLALAAVPVSLVLAAGSYHLIEKPFLRLKRRFQAKGDTNRSTSLERVKDDLPAFAVGDARP